MNVGCWLGICLLTWGAQVIQVEPPGGLLSEANTTAVIGWFFLLVGVCLRARIRWF